MFVLDNFMIIKLMGSLVISILMEIFIKGGLRKGSFKVMVFIIITNNKFFYKENMIIIWEMECFNIMLIKIICKLK